MSNRGVGDYAESHIGNGTRDHSNLGGTVEEKTAIGETPLQEAGLQALRLYLRRLRKSLASLEDADDAATIHDARVAVRELRAMTQLLEPSPCFNGKWLHQMDKGLGQLARTLGTVRDTDVFMERLERYMDQHTAASEGLGRLQHNLRARRRRAARQVHTTLQRGKTRRLLQQARRQMQRLQKASTSTTAPVRTSASSHRYPLLLRHFAGSAIWGRYEEILSYQMVLPEAGAETLHKLRIACKRLRYSMQIFGPPPAALSETMATLKAAQDQLGQLHDAFYAEKLTRELQQASSPDIGLANWSYREFLDALAEDAAQLKPTIGPLWQQLTGLPTRQTIANFIASL